MRLARLGSVCTQAWVASACLVAATVLSGNDTLAAVLVAFGLVIGIPTVVRQGRDHLVVRLVAAAGSMMLLSGALVGSLPDLGSPSQWTRWSSGEGRSIVALAALAIGVTVRRTDLERLQRVVVALVVGSIACSLPFYLLRTDLPGFRVRGGALLFALGSSHHVVGFTTAVAILVLLSSPRLFHPMAMTVSASVCLLGLGLSGSRSGLIGVALGSLAIVFIRLGRRRGLIGLAGLVVVGAAMIPLVPRFRTTAEVVTRPEFFDEASTLFREGDLVLAIEMSDTRAEANMLLRFAMWGRSMEFVERSPVVGVGAYRINDRIQQWVGIEHLVQFGVGDGFRVFGDSQPHNMYLHLLGELGVLGTALYLSPFFVVGVRLWRRRPDDIEAVTMGLGLLAMPVVVGLVSAALLTTALALPMNGLLGAAVNEPVDR